MEVITGVAPAEYGDKSSLVVHIVTKSGLDQAKPTGQRVARVRLVQEADGRAQYRRGSHAIGNFLSVSGMRTDRFLDPPEFQALHDTGNSLSLFDRVDVHPNDRDTFHFNAAGGAVGVRCAEHL